MDSADSPVPLPSAGFEPSKIMPVLRVADISVAVAWYTRMLGFRIAWQHLESDAGAVCRLVAGETSLLLSTGSHLGGTPAFTGTLYFEVEGVRELFRSVSARLEDETQIVWPLQAMDYGTLEFGLRDPDGYILAFAEENE